VLAGLLTLGVILAAGVYWDVAVMVWVPFVTTVFPAVSLVGSGVYHLVARLRGRD
jgi:hypothetical protein